MRNFCNLRIFLDYHFLFLAKQFRKCTQAIFITAFTEVVARIPYTAGDGGGGKRV
jgi:hypothetical protein